MSFAPIATAPRDPVTDLPPSPAHPDRIRQGPELALLCGLDDATYLIRGCWRTVGDQPGTWWDLDNGEPIDLIVIAWAAMPEAHEVRVMLAAVDAR